MESVPVKVERLTRHYGKRRGVEELTFEVQEGEIFGFLGPNGAGKTTTIRQLMGLSVRLAAARASSASTAGKIRSG